MIKIYSTPTCPYCQIAKQYFKENNLQFEDIDVSTNLAAAEEMIERSGQLGVPVLDVNGKIVIGFNKPMIDELLGLKKP